MRICFFVNMSRHANWREMFDKVEFYRVDIALLRSLGHDVVLAGHPRALDRAADIYFVWWWGHAPPAILLGKARRKPVVVTGAFDYSTARNEIPGLSYLDRPLWQRIALQAALRTADANLFISQAEFDEVTDALKVRNPICAPLAVDTDFYKPEARDGPGDFFFSVSWSSRTNALRKGMPQTIDAFSRIADRYPHMRLVLAGKQGDYLDTLIDQAQRVGVGDRVEFPGMISDEEKLRNYRNCAAYVQPTLYEGFGHAIAEAVASGAHVVTALRGAVPEVAGPHASCVDPHDIDAIAAAMAACVENPRSQADKDVAHRWIVENYALNIRRNRLAAILEAVA